MFMAVIPSAPPKLPSSQQDVYSSMCCWDHSDWSDAQGDLDLHQQQDGTSYLAARDE